MARLRSDDTFRGRSELQPPERLLAPGRYGPSKNRGAFMSVNSTILRLGQTLGPPLMAAAATPFGLGGAYFAAAALAFAMLLVAVTVIR